MAKTVLFIIGSTRKASFNKQLADEIIAMAGDCIEAKILDYAAVPLLNQDEEYPAPEAVSAVRAAVMAADALWVITPEYNASYPGRLKNVLDWLSRPLKAGDYATPTVLRGKKAIISGAAGKSAAIHSRQKRAELLTVIGIDLFEGAGLGVALGSDSFGSGKLVIAEEVRKELKELVDRYIKWISE